MDLVDAAGVEEDALGEGGFARIYMGRYSDVANAVHGLFPPRILFLICASKVREGMVAEIEVALEKGTDRGGRRGFGGGSREDGEVE